MTKAKPKKRTPGGNRASAKGTRTSDADSPASAPAVKRGASGLRYVRAPVGDARGRRELFIALPRDTTTSIVVHLASCA